MTRRELLERAWRMQAAITAALTVPNLHAAVRILPRPEPKEISGAQIMAWRKEGYRSVRNLQQNYNAMLSAHVEMITQSDLLRAAKRVGKRGAEDLRFGQGYQW